MTPRWPRATPIAGWVVLCVAVLAAVTVLAPRPPHSGGLARVVLVPPEVRAGRATAVYGGIAALERPGLVELAVCAADGPCRVVATTALSAGESYWGWLGALRLAAGDHEVQLLVRERTRWFGARTVAVGVWHVAAH